MRRKSRRMQESVFLCCLLQKRAEITAFAIGVSSRLPKQPGNLTGSAVKMTSCSAEACAGVIPLWQSCRKTNKSSFLAASSFRSHVYSEAKQKISLFPLVHPFFFCGSHLRSSLGLRHQIPSSLKQSRAVGLVCGSPEDGGRSLIQL